jgi:hypothetical protein
MLPAVTSERLPAPIATRVVEVVSPGRSVERIRTEVESIRAIAGQPTSRLARRFVFLWFRVFVDERKHGKRERVNLRIPIPIPVIGTFFPLGLSRQKALKALALAEASDDPAMAVSDYLDSVMGFELVRVEEQKGDRGSLVVVGFD